MQIQATLRNHVERLNEIPMFSSSIKVFIPENNLANEGSHMWNMLKKLPDMRCYWEKNDRPGVHKGKDTADDYQYMFNVKLKADAIRFDSEFFTTSRKHSVTSIKGVLRKQIEQFHFAYEEPKTVHQTKGKQTITGKVGTSEQDDLIIALLMGVFWGRIVLKNPKRLD